MGGLSVLCPGPAPVTMGADDQVGECPALVVHVVVFAVDVVIVVVVVVGGGGGGDEPLILLMMVVSMMTVIVILIAIMI